MDMIFYIVGIPVGCVVGGILGRKIQRYMWLYHLPYEERVKAFCKR